MARGFLLSRTGQAARYDRDVTSCWVIDPDEPPLCVDEADWLAVPLEQRQAAIEWATDYLHRALGGQFGLCPVTVRPCMRRDCNNMGFWWGAWWSGSLWTPYLWQGQWFNCFCGNVCCCEPRCQVELAGPVNSIIEVTIDGVVVDPSTYRVDDNRWRVREGGLCWPQCPNFDNPAGGEGVWEVTYPRGREVPTSVLNAIGTLAWEWILACRGSSACRISSWVVAMDRQGTSFQFVNPVEILTLGLSGIKEIDMLIRAYNPAGLRQQPKVLSGVNQPWPRQQTWP